MSQPKTEDDDDNSDGRGCLFIVGLVIIAICIGNIYTAAAGWLVLGVGFLIAALLPSERENR